MQAVIDVADAAAVGRHGAGVGVGAIISSVISNRKPCALSSSQVSSCLNKTVPSSSRSTTISFHTALMVSSVLDEWGSI